MTHSISKKVPVIKPHFYSSSSASAALALTLSAFAATAFGQQQSTVALPANSLAPFNLSLQLKSTTAYEKLLDIANKAESQNPFLIQSMHSWHYEDVVQALYVAAALADRSLTEPVAATLQNKNPKVRAAAAFALGQIGGEGALNSLLTALVAEKSDEVKGVLFVSLGKVSSKPQLSLFLNALTLHKHAAVVAGAAEGLALLWTRDREGWTVPESAWGTLLALLQAPPQIADKAAVALVRYRGEKKESFVEPLLAAIKGASSPSAKASAIRALGTLKFPAAKNALLKAAQMPAVFGVRVEIVNGLAKQDPSPETTAAIAAFLQDPNTQVVVAALEALAALKNQGAQFAPNVAKLFDTTASQSVQKNALATLAAISPETTRPLVAKLFAQPTSRLYTAAIAALAQIATPEDTPKLLELLLSDKNEVVIAALDALNNLELALASPLNLQAAVETGLALKDSHALCSATDIATKWQLKSTLPQFIDAYKNASQEDSSDARICILNVVAALGTPADAAFLEAAISDDIAQVSSAAADAFEKLTKAKSSLPVTVHSKLNRPTPSLQQVRKAVHSTLVFHTSRGEFSMKMLSVAPLTATNIVQLAKQGFYNNLNFHRVVPHFVAQGGDPRGDGWGGPGYFIRNEPTLLPHDVGNVGIATSGKDTGGSQFFINMATNLHLDGEYTVFAKVTQGLSVAQKLEEGDVIYSVGVK